MRALLAALAFGLLLPACVSPDDQALREHVRSTYYTTLAGERQALLGEFTALADLVDPSQLPTEYDAQFAVIPIMEQWVVWSDRFDVVTAADDDEPTIKPIRDTYREGHELITLAMTEWFAAMNPTRPDAQRRERYAAYADAYRRAVDLLGEARGMVERVIDGR